MSRLRISSDSSLPGSGAGPDVSCCQAAAVRSLLDVVDDFKKASVKFGERYTLDELVHGEVFHPVA